MERPLLPLSSTTKSEVCSERCSPRTIGGVDAVKMPTAAPSCVEISQAHALESPPSSTEKTATSPAISSVAGANVATQRPSADATRSVAGGAVGVSDEATHDASPPGLSEAIETSRRVPSLSSTTRWTGAAVSAGGALVTASSCPGVGALTNESTAAPGRRARVCGGRARASATALSDDEGAASQPSSNAESPPNSSVNNDQAAHSRAPALGEKTWNRQEANRAASFGIEREAIPLCRQQPAAVVG